MARISRRAFVGAASGTVAALASPRSVAVPAPSTHDASGEQPVPGREAFALDPAMAYLNNGSLGPTPTCVTARVRETEARLELNPVGMQWGRIGDEADAARADVARFLGCRRDELAVTRNTTEAMNAIAEGVHLRPGDRVLTTDQEHPGGVVGWEHETRYRGVVIDRVSLPEATTPDQMVVEAFAARLAPRTRVISVSHVTYTTGQCLPIQALAVLAESAGCLLVVDGAQAAGAIPVDLAGLGCHAYATSAHKWMLAPKGTGLLFVRESARSRIQPLLLRDGPGVYTATTGTRHLPGIVGLGAAASWMERLGMARVQSHADQLRTRLLAWVDGPARRRRGLGVLSPRAPAATAGIVTLALPVDLRAAEVTERLQREFGVVVRAVTVSQQEALRISLHVYNQRSDVDRLVEGLNRILRDNA